MVSDEAVHSAVIIWSPAHWLHEAQVVELNLYEPEVQVPHPVSDVAEHSAVTI